MTYSVTPLSGVNLDYTTTTNLNSAAVEIPTFGPLGTQVFGSDGKRYVFAKAGAAVTASTATCSINASTFVVTASGGTYKSPAIALASGDYAWFAATSV
jgi:hypothetical protein